MTMRRKPDFVMSMQGERETLEIYGWPLPKETPMSDIELPRQRQTVVVAMTGDLRDVEFYMDILRKAAERSGDDTQRMGNQFKIYPRANND